MWTAATSSATGFATIGDPEGTRTVTSIVGLLVALGLALLMVAVWLWRSTRPDPELLAPLEVMGERKWRRADPVAQRRTLDAVRPEGAEPLTPSAAPPVLDQTFDAGPSAAGFDDLHVEDEPEVGNLRSVRHDRPRVMPVGEVTPRQIARPASDVFEHEIDPEVLAAADAELQAELDARPPGGDDAGDRPDGDTTVSAGGLAGGDPDEPPPSAEATADDADDGDAE